MPGRIQAIERAAAVIELVDTAPMGLAELSRVLDLPKPTVHGILRTLVDVGFVRQDPETGRYAVGERLRDMGRVTDPYELRSLARNWSDRLAARTGLEVHLGIPADAGAVMLLDHVFRPDGSTQSMRVGETAPVHVTALGKVLLALAPGVGPVRTLDLAAFTAATTTSPDDLAAELLAVRRRGWALEAGEHFADVAGVAAPVRDAGGVVVAAVGVVGRHEQVLTGREPRAEVLEQVVATGRAIGRRLGERG